MGFSSGEQLPSLAHPMQLSYLFDHGGLLVLNKPPDLPTSGRTLSDPDCLQFKLMQARQEKLWAVHQLDADTSGLNLFVSQKALVQVHKERLAWPSAEKLYLSILHGQPSWQEMRVDAPTGPLPGTPKQLGVTPSGRPSASHFKVLARGPGHHLAQIRLETGRTHQIRIHAAHIGHPLVGEEWYRSPACLEHPRQALHASRIRYRDSHEPSELWAPFPEDLRHLAARLGLRLPEDC